EVHHPARAQTMTSRDRRALIGGGIVVLAATFLLRIVPWGIRKVFAAQDELRERATLLAHAREEIATTLLLRDSTAVLTRALGSLAPKLLSGGTAAEANADIAAWLNMFVSRSLAKLERIDQLPDSASAGRLGRVRAHAA